MGILIYKIFNNKDENNKDEFYELFEKYRKRAKEDQGADKYPKEWND